MNSSSLRISKRDFSWMMTIYWTLKGRIILSWVEFLDCLKHRQWIDFVEFWNRFSISYSLSWDWLTEISSWCTQSDKKIAFWNIFFYHNSVKAQKKKIVDAYDWCRLLWCYADLIVKCFHSADLCFDIWMCVAFLSLCLCPIFLSILRNSP